MNSELVSQILVIFARVSAFLATKESLFVLDEASTGHHVIAADSVGTRAVVGIWRVSELFGRIRLEIIEFVLAHHLLGVQGLFIFILVKCLLDGCHVRAVSFLVVVGVN